MIIIIDQPTANEKHRALALVESETWNAWELYEVLYSPKDGETLGTVGADHAKFVCAGTGATLMSAVLDRMIVWAAPEGEVTPLRLLVERMNAQMSAMQTHFPGPQG